MSRSGYSEGCDGWQLIMWREAVASAIRGKRGQQLLRDLVDALDARPNKRLISCKLEENGEVCALGSVGQKRGINMQVHGLNDDDYFDDYDGDKVASLFGIAPALAKEVMFINDEASWGNETPEARWRR